MSLTPTTGMRRNELQHLLTEHQKPDTFLKALLLHLDLKEHQQLYNNLVRAEREGRCLRRAVLLTLVLLMLSLAGVVYCALLIPETFRDPANYIMRSLSVLILGSLISQVVFLGHLFWHRIAMRRLQRECRCLVLALVRTQHKEPPTPDAAI